MAGGVFMRSTSRRILALFGAASLFATLVAAPAQGSSSGAYILVDLNANPQPEVGLAIPVDNTSAFSDSGGLAVLEPGTSDEELIVYSGLDGNSLTEVTRANPGAHEAGSYISVNADIIDEAIAAWVKVAETTPTIGMGVGKSANVAVDLSTGNTCNWLIHYEWEYNKPAFSTTTDEYSLLDVEGNCDDEELFLDAYTRIDDFGIQIAASTKTTNDSDSRYGFARAEASQAVQVYTFPADIHGPGSRLLFHYRVNARAPWGETFTDCFEVNVIQGFIFGPANPCLVG